MVKVSEQIFVPELEIFYGNLKKNKKIPNIWEWGSKLN